ncbi:MAG TPA: ATP-dependent endonuclease [Candidatus Paceibacterota bacterium]
MYINRIGIRNFRLLKNSTLDFKDNLCMIIGRNNCGKTSFLVLFEKFYNGSGFDYNDFSVSLRDAINKIDKTTIATDLAIQLTMEIVYEENDNLSNISEFILDLDPHCKSVNILFECCINKVRLLDAISKSGNIEKEKYIRKYLSSHIDNRVYIFETEDDLKPENRYRIIKKDMAEVKKIIDFEIIHAKRSVSSSEEKTSHKVLSGLTTKYFNDNNINSPDKFEEINSLIVDMDKQLGDKYEVFFDGFLKNSRDFLRMDGLKIISNIKASEIVNDSSEVIYGDDSNYLPEYLNGLGYMNVLYLLLSIEIKKSKFDINKKDIKLLFIEEPEAHTHPQLQYIFARKIDSLLSDISGLQAIITTHSPHIVSNHPFENIRYMLQTKDADGSENVEIKNFHKELSLKYTDKAEFQFIKQYLSIEAAELFFASKIIFIEGISENMLMPYFISLFDKEKINAENKEIESGIKEKKEYIPLSSQNISILQVGSNAKVFRHFLEFLDIKTLVITDIDTTKLSDTKRYCACKVDGSPDATSNETIKYYFNSPDLSRSIDYKVWLENIINMKTTGISDKVNVFYQKQELGYHARSFEDAFINVNLELMKEKINDINGLKNKDDFKTETNIYELTKSVIDKKSDFASALLFLVHTNDAIDWKMPLYIKEGLEWIQQ